MEIPLRKKYLTAIKGRQKGGERPAPKKNRTKIGEKRHRLLFGTPRPRTLLVNAQTGHSVMVYSDELEG